ncbi:hypothetical protein DRJ25_00650 [Candidatus Woesearchaeota archaeon]|nr:MAG: hypothetical protein DRJ25_00650 [Candidatus Woesearchaeota archaeon]
MASVDEFKKRVELFFCEDNLGLEALATGFYKYFEQHRGDALLKKDESGDFVHQDKARGLLKEDFEKKYFSVLENLASSFGVELDKDDVCFSKDFGVLVGSLRTYSYCTARPDLPVVASEVSSSPSFNVGVLDSLVSDLNYVTHLAVDDFRVFLDKQKLFGHAHSVRESSEFKFPWIRYVFLTSVLVVVGVLSGIYALFQSEKSKLVDEVRTELNSGVDDVVKPYFPIVTDDSGRKVLNEDYKAAVDLIFQYVKDNYSDELNDSLDEFVKRLKSELPDYVDEVARKKVVDFFEKYDNDPEFRERFNRDFWSFLDELSKGYK